jgi:hypothetical protein
LNAIIKTYQNESLAITSIGLDGELIDNVTSLPKPRIYVYEDMIVATAAECLDVTEAEYEVLLETDVRSALGDIKIVRIIKAGNCLVGGPSTIVSMERIIKILKTFKVDKILIDGAFSRKTISKTSDACIFAVGAVKSPDMDQVISAAKLTIRQFALPKIPAEYEHLEAYETITLIDHEGGERVLSIDSVLSDPEVIFGLVDETTRFVYLPGALSQQFAKEYIRRRRTSLPDIILKSPTHLVLPENIMGQLFQAGIRIFVINPINLIGVAYNPFSPTGYVFDEIQFRQSLIGITSLPIINVMNESEEVHE